MLTGLPHPSGANAQRSAFFLGRKERQALSPQVRPERLIAARTELKAKIAMLAAEHVECAQTAWLDLESLVDDANHLVVIDQPDVVAEQLQKFLGAKVRRRPSRALTSSSRWSLAVRAEPPSLTTPVIYERHMTSPMRI